MSSTQNKISNSGQFQQRRFSSIIQFPDFSAALNEFALTETRQYLVNKQLETGQTIIIGSHLFMKTRLFSLLAASLMATVLTVSAAEEIGFVPLFNGKNTDGWKLRNANGHNSWTVADGILKNTVNKGEHGTDLVTTKKFWNFTVRYDFMVPEGSNSGFYLRGRHEIQILGDAKSGKTSKGGNGAIYAHTAPSVFASKPGWQTAEVTIIGHKISVTLNGTKIHDNVVCKRATGSEIDRNVNEPGPIFLQGDHGTVSFRNMRIKELAKE